MKKIIVITLTVLMLGGAISYFYYKKSGSSINSQVLTGSEISRDIIEEKKRLISLMDKMGTKKTYQQFKSEYENVHFGRQHTVAHIVGELIYEKEGINGLAICDATFAFGCYHSFFGKALAENGPDVISEMDKACIDKFGPLGTGCQHGIGHGLMEYFGHDKLISALDACSTTSQKNPLFGCTSGVFMEYNVPIVITASDAFTKPRKLDKKDPYNPCPNLLSKYQESCYNEMAQWWDKEGNYWKDYQKIGQLCQAIPESKNREACFLGTGNVAAPGSQYNVVEAIDKCNKMPTKETRLLCRSGASWSFFSSVTYRHLAAEVCDDLDLEAKSKCVQDSDLIGNGEILNNN